MDSPSPFMLMPRALRKDSAPFVNEVTRRYQLRTGGKRNLLFPMA